MVNRVFEIMNLPARPIKTCSADLDIETIYESDVKDMPVAVDINSDGTSVHDTGPRDRQAKIGKIPMAAH